jgi:uncharacterized protein (TIGR02284 family)
VAKHLVQLLNDLISSLRDSQEGLDKAAKGAHSDDLRSTFDAISVKRAAFAEELGGEVERLGGKAAQMGHGGGPLSAGWVELESRIRPKSDAEFIANCERGEENTIKHYDHALSQDDLPGEIRAVIAGQRSSVEETIEQLRRLERVNRAA